MCTCIRCVFYVRVGRCAVIPDNIMGHGHIVKNIKLNMVFKIMIVFCAPGTEDIFVGLSWGEM